MAASSETVGGGGLFDGGPDGRSLRADAFTPGGWAVLQGAVAAAARSAHEFVGPHHLMLALLVDEEDAAGAFEGLLPPKGRSGPKAIDVAGAVARAFQVAVVDDRDDAEGGARKALDPTLVALLAAAYETARNTPSGALAPEHLAFALFSDLPPRLETILRLPPLSLDPADIRDRLAEAVGRVEEEGDSEDGFPWLPGLLPSDDLTASAHAGLITPAVTSNEADGPYGKLARALYRKGDRHVLITGLKGVGKTTVVRELARRAAAGEIAFLADKRFLWADAADVAPEEGRDCLAGVFAKLAGSNDVVLCIDGLGTLLRKEGGGGNALYLRALLRATETQLVGVMSRWEYNDLVASEPEAFEAFTRIDVEEPGDELAEAIVRQAAGELAARYGLTIPESVAGRAVALSSTYMLSERLPAKALKVLRRACDDLDFERTQCDDDRRELNEGDVLRVVAELTGIPEDTLAGAGDAEDFEAALAASVVGQDDAVRTVANELALIKAGLTEPNKPASVLLFAGTTGVGKTELAKRLAELYSASRRVQVYTMGNFTEPHTVSGIIGVPAGYVGHDQGGRLVNELNADPYAVFLLDEAEKAHPNVWKPFLNLFDEGWIVDQRGVKAHADRAIFILTTNAGDDAIAQMTQSGSSPEAIEAHVKGTLSRVRQERSGQPVFTPQFLARVKKVVVFRPLSEDAMIGITRTTLARIQTLWLRKREKAIEAPEELAAAVGRLAHRLNTEAGGKEGGRIVRKLIADLVETPIQREATRRRAEYQACKRIVLSLAPQGEAAPAAEGGPPAPPPTPEVLVRFEGAAVRGDDAAAVLDPKK